MTQQTIREERPIGFAGTRSRARAITRTARTLLIGETLRVALDALRANKLRSLLTMLGIVIGVAAVIAMVALGRGAQQTVRERITSLGTTLITVRPGQSYWRHSPGDRAQLTFDDAAAIEAQATYITAVQPELDADMQVQFENRSTSTDIVGATANYLEVRNFEIGAGRMFDGQDNASRRRVAVVGPQVLTDLEIEAPVQILGKSIRINRIQFEVIGVFESKGQAGWRNPDDQVVIPIETARYRLIGGDQVRTISALALSEADMPLAMAEIQLILRREHRLRSGQPDDFSIRNQTDFLATLGETTQVFTLLLAGIAVVSLLVGGIGIMNIMLVSVTERTREIGIRKALGASQTNILLQFLIEAVVLCLMGGLIGVAVGGGGAVLMREFFSWNTSVGPSSVLIAFSFSFLVGMVFGVWPARRAASLDPIEALRYE